MFRNLSLITLLFAFSFFGCKQHVTVDPVPFNEIISPYINETVKQDVLDANKFNAENYQLGKIYPIINKKDSLEFIFIFNHSHKILYYKNGEEVFYVPEK